MAKINLTLEHTIVSGETITFEAPCDCTAVDGIRVTYPVVNEDGSLSEATAEFCFRDAHCNDLAGLGNLFAEGAVVKAVLRTETGCAYIQNGDTNGYLEGRINTLAGKSTISAVTLSASGWANSSAPYVRSVSLSGVTATSVVELLPGDGVNAAQLIAMQSANIQGGSQSAGSIQLKAFGAKPSIDLPVRFIVRGDM